MEAAALAAAAARSQRKIAPGGYMKYTKLISNYLRFGRIVHSNGEIEEHREAEGCSNEVIYSTRFLAVRYPLNLIK